jgi:hypothetical protein
MSLHAQLTPEAEERLRAQKRNSTISSVLISILLLVLLGLVLAFILLPSLFVKPPVIVTYNAGLPDEEELEKKQINNQIKRQTSAPSSSMAKVIASTTPSPTAIPVPEVDVPNPSTDFGSGDDFGDGWGSGGEGSGGGFGNIPATMRKRCSKADRLQRLAENGGTPECEDAVLNALRWMQKTQAKDGSWKGHKVANTGLALLAYLGHCETPLSEEFGETVTAAITYLVNVAMKNNGRMADDLKSKHWPYEHAIATYAVAEAYTFCKQLNINLPNLEEAAQNSVQWVIDNQHKGGGWDYLYDEDGPRGGDLSIAAWHMQALKAGHHTGLDFRNYRSCVSKGLSYVEDRQGSNGAFAYTGKNGKIGLTGAGALCLQQHKGSANSSARKGCRFIEKEAQFKYKAGPANLYGHYYHSQAMINQGGKAWAKYNALFRDELLNNQSKDGSWPAPGGGGHGSNDITMRTAFSTLMLEVYYRFLPGTGQKS